MAAPITPRLKALQNLSNQLPVANQRVAQGQAAARDIQIQQAVRAAPTAQGITQSAQQTGAASAASAGQQMVEQASQQVKQQGQVSQLGLQEQQMQSQATVAGLQSGARESAMDNTQRLAAISEKAKKELYDDQMQFRKDEQGRTIFNERQLLDAAATSARNEQDYLNKMQTIRQASERELAISEHAYNMITQDLEQKIKLAEQQKDQKLAVELANMKKAAEDEMNRKRNAANNRAQMFQAGGMIAGAVIGSAVPGAGTAAGAMAGAAIGSAAGGLVASQTSDTKAGT